MAMFCFSGTTVGSGLHASRGNYPEMLLETLA